MARKDAPAVQPCLAHLRRFEVVDRAGEHVAVEHDEVRAFAGFERAGVWVDSEGRALDDQGSPLAWLYAAGDAVADAPRTLLEAIRSGIAVGALAAT